MREWAGYWGAVIRRAWLEACTLMLPDSWKVFVRDGFILLAATGAMFVFRAPLAEQGIIGRADNPALDNLIPVAFGLAALVAIFAAYFLIEALFIAPFRLSREGKPSQPVVVEREADETMSAPPVILDRRFTDPEHLDHVCNLVIRATRPLGQVVVTGRFALPVHYLSEARWKWSLPVRLASADMLTDEVIEVPYFDRPAASRGRGDPIKALGRDVPLRWENPDQGEMVRIEVTVHADGEAVKEDRIWQFRRSSNRHYTDAISPLGIDYPDDRITL